MPEGVGKVLIRTDDGLKDYRTCTKFDANEEHAADTVIFEGKNYARVKLSDGKYHYILPGDGEGVSATKSKEYDEKTAFWSWDNSQYDEVVDSTFDSIDRMIGIDNSTIPSKEEDDGKISWKEKGSHFLKGAISLVKGFVKHPVVSIGAAVGLAAVCCIPVAGPVIATGLFWTGTALAAGTTAYGTYKACTAKTDSEAKNAWENIGAGVVSLIPLAKMAPKDGAYRTFIGRQANKVARLGKGTFRTVKTPKGTIKQSVKNFGKRHFGGIKEADQTMENVKATVDAAKTAVNNTRLSDAKTHIAELYKLKQCEPLADKAKEIEKSIEELESLYANSAATYNVPNVRFMLSQDAYWNNLGDSSAKDMQNLANRALTVAEAN